MVKPASDGPADATARARALVTSRSYLAAGSIVVGESDELADDVVVEAEGEGWP